MAKVYLSPSNQTQNYGVGDYGTEKSRMIPIAEAVQRELAKKFEVRMGNYDWGVSARCNESNNWGSDVYVAIHSNAGGGRGCEVWAYSTESQGYRLAQCIYNRIAPITPSNDRGVKIDPEYIETRDPYCPAVIIEVAFHDNWEDADFIMHNAELIGKEIAKGIYEYFGVAYEEPVVVPPAPEPTPEPEPEEPVIIPIPNEPTTEKKWYIILVDKIIELLKKIFNK